MSEALITTSGEQVWPDLPKVSGNYRFGGNERHINPACEQHNSKPCNSFYFFDIFLLLRSTQEVTTGNLSLNKWKTWPVEFFEDCEKYEKNLGGENSNFRGEFGDSKIVEPAVGGIDRSKKIFWSILIYGTSKLEFVCESYGCFTNGLRIRGQNGPEVGKICDGG
jgi:hypothetical protein